MSGDKHGGKDRQSGTGQPIKSIPAKGGAGVGNWGSNSEEIKDGKDAAGAPKRRKPKNFADLNEDAGFICGPEHESYEEYMKKNMPKDKKIEPYQVKTHKSKYKKKYNKSAKHEKETDLMFGPIKGGKKKKMKKKKRKMLLQTECFYGAPVKGSDDRPRGGGRGRGRGRGRGDSTRGGGYRGGRGDRGRGFGGRGGGYGGRGGGRGYGGGYGGRGGGYGGGYGGGGGRGYGGYGRGGGFGSRGRGYENNYSDNQQNHQNPNEFQGGNGGNDGGDGMAPVRPQAPQPMSNPADNMNQNAPVSVQ